MGSPGGLADERPVHDAEVRPLRVATAPVTNGEYACFLASGHAMEPPWWKDPDFWDPQQPVVGVTWREAVAYCGWLAGTGGGRWRLPTEAEWEHACGPADEPAPPGAGGERRAQPIGPRPVGRGMPNAYGLHDVGTLVHEWCQDWYAPDAYLTARRYDPRGPEAGEKRVCRGRSWRERHRTTLSVRRAVDPLTRAIDGGFRVVREVP